MCSLNLRCIFTVSLRSARLGAFCLLAFGIAACGPVGADSHRRTTDWQADLVSVLAERRMTDAAALICQRHFSEAEPRSDAAARWAIRWSAVQASELLGSESVTEDELTAAKQPVAGLLQSYDQHHRRLWLRTQLAMVDFAAAQHFAVAYAVAGHRSKLHSRGLEQISSTLRQLDDIEQSLTTELSRIASARGETVMTSAELIALQQNVGKQRVAAYLLRSNLFPEDSDDAIASATQAVAAADAVLTRMQARASLRPEVLLSKAEAVYRSGDPASAAELLEALQQSLHGALPPEALALQVRLAVEQAPAKAAEILAGYYGSDPASAPVSIEMDLARLRWLLEQRDSQESGSTDQRSAQIADWLDAVEQRGGAYARRRGEAETLQRMRVGSDSSDVRLLAAEAAKRLREGEAIAAADLLVQAASSAPEPAQAIEYAQQAAAVLLSEQRPGEASKILVQTARTHRSEPTAAKAHLQAALVRSKMLNEATETDVEPLIEMLKEHADLWPQMSTTKKAVPWLLDILSASRRYTEAARFLMNQAEPKKEDVRRAGEFWRLGLRAIDDADEQQQLVEEAVGLFSNIGEQPPELRRVADWQSVSLAAFFGTRTQLQRVQPRFPDSPEETTTADERFRFVHAFVRFRLEGRPASALPTRQLPAHRSTVIDAIERLHVDGKERPREQRRLGTAMSRLFEILGESEVDKAKDFNASIDPFIEPLAHLWAGEADEAASQIKRIVERVSAENKADAMQRAATILADSDSVEAKRTAISYWKRLAQGLPQGSPRWHEAKLAVARLLIDLGETKEAKQICRYVLITRSPKDPAIRAEYEAILQR